MMEVMSYEKTTNCSSGMSRGRSHRICSGIFNTESRKRGDTHRNFTDFVYSRAYREKDTTENYRKSRLRDKNGTGRISYRAAGKSAAHGKTTAFCPGKCDKLACKGRCAFAVFHGQDGLFPDTRPVSV